MREIKFRFFGKNDEFPEGKMYMPGDLPIVLNMFGDPIHAPSGNSIEKCCFARVGWNDSTVMQYTGLKDKNGVEIYEGDIVAHISTRRAGYQKDGDMIYKKIVFGKTNTDMSDLTDYIGFWATRLNDDDIESGGSIEYQVASHGAIVIGNIHSNPELLES